MLGRMGKVLGSLFAVIIGIAVLAYGVLYVINLHDRPVSPAAESLLALHDVEQIADERNAYVMLIGFGAPPDTDPVQYGVARRAAGPADRPEANRPRFQDRRSDAVAELALACGASAEECLESLDGNSAAASQWTLEERWLLHRYRSLLDLSEFQEVVPFNNRLSLPYYGDALEAQTLFLVNAWLAAAGADAATVRQTLDEDLKFWRMLLENSDSLITKTIAAAAIEKHFKLGNLVLRNLPRKMARAAVPPSWQTPISDSERSLLRALAGEWRMWDSMNREINENDGRHPQDPDDQNLWERIGWTLSEPLWQPQHMSNRYAQLILDVNETLSVPYRDMQEAAKNADRLYAEAFKPYEGLYNPIGNFLMPLIAMVRVSPYATRMSDLEGVRRAALLVTELRAAGLTDDILMDAIRISEFTDPYSGTPLHWDANTRTIIFHGIEPRQRSRHLLIL